MATEILPPALTEEVNKSPKLLLIFSLSMQSCRFCDFASSVVTSV